MRWRLTFRLQSPVLNAKIQSPFSLYYVHLFTSPSFNLPGHLNYHLLFPAGLFTTIFFKLHLRDRFPFSSLLLHILLPQLMRYLLAGNEKRVAMVKLTATLEFQELCCLCKENLAFSVYLQHITVGRNLKENITHYTSSNYH